MELIIADGSVAVAEPEILTALSVCTRLDDATTYRMLVAEGLCAEAVPAHPSGDHVWLDIAALRDRAGAEKGADWHEGYDAMVAYALSRGWVSPDGAAVRAHVERS
ncbi:hypothetical protein [Nocardioides humi]|uniref:hypothetical protein n=1 Tax=Nocardioides humi TaxID=449461 RepID=UPI00112671AF|nr:hypothetical protein [Nocardioides humi]